MEKSLAEVAQKLTNHIQGAMEHYRTVVAPGLESSEKAYHDLCERMKTLVQADAFQQSLQQVQNAFNTLQANQATAQQQATSNTEIMQAILQELPQESIFYHSLTTEINELIRSKCDHPAVIRTMNRMLTFLDSRDPSPGTCHRGMRLKGKSRELMESLLTVGSVHSDPGFICASMSEDVAYRFAFPEEGVVDDVPPAHSKIEHFSGRNVEKFVAPGYQDEEEVLFKPRTRFLVVSCTVCQDYKDRAYYQVMWKEVDPQSRPGLQC